jgi:hypothetical protein
MGLRHSTRTRVTPIFDFLALNDPTGQHWLGGLLRLPTGGHGSPPVEPGLILDSAWGEIEKRLEPPRALLHWLVDNLPSDAPDGMGTKTVATQVRRQQLVDRDPRMLQQAHALLDRSHARTGEWCVFEGVTQPDVYIETESLIIVIEGKRTEARATRGTAWMPVREQLLRHLDCAWEVRNGKRVVGFYIVEGEVDDDRTSMSIGPAWQAAARDIQSREVIDASLPHRSPGERAEIASGFLGVTTWQRLAAEFNLEWPKASRATRISDPYRFALVELSARHYAAEYVEEGIKKALRAQPQKRNDQVRAIVESMVLDDVDLIVLPGWSLVGIKPPDWLVDRSRGRTIVVEMLNPEQGGGAKTDGSSLSYVLQDGRVALRQLKQMLSSSSEAWEKGEYSTQARETGMTWVEKRRWLLPTGGTAMLALCGEINILQEKAPDEALSALRLDRVPLVVNSSHTRMKPQGSREQRMRLSKSALVLVTANTYEAGKASDRASWEAAEIYWQGEHVKLSEAEVTWSADDEVRAQRIWLDDRTSQGTPIVLGEISQSRLK